MTANWGLLDKVWKPGENHRVGIQHRRQEIYTWRWPLEQDDKGKLNPLSFCYVYLTCSDMMFVLLCTLSVKQESWEFRYKLLQFEEDFDNLFIDNSIADENAWASTGDEPIASEGTTPAQRSRSRHSIRFYGVVNTTIVPNAPDMIDELKQARKKKLKILLRRHPHDWEAPWRGKLPSAYNCSWRWPNPWWVKENDNPRRRISWFN